MPNSSFYFKEHTRPANERIDYRVHPAKQMKPRAPISPHSDEYTQQLVVNTPDLETFVGHHIAHKKIFFQTLDILLREEGVTLDSAKLFAHIARESRNGIYGSEHLMVMRDQLPHDARNESERITEAETTTPYVFLFRFASVRAHGKNHAISLLEMDARVWKLLEQYDVPSEMKESFCEGMLRQRDRSGHDYLHQLVMPLMEHSTLSFGPHKHRVGQGEIQAIALHAKICARIFKEQPWRKTQMLEDVTGMVQLLADMQDVAVKNAMVANAAPETLQEIHTAITYLAEVAIGHSLFRIVQPGDRALHKAVNARVPAWGDVPARVVESSLAEACDRLALVVPDHIREKTHLRPEAKGFEQLRANCKDWLDNLYEQVHQVTKMPLYENYGKRHALPPQPVSVVGILGRFVEERQVQQPFVERLSNSARAGKSGHVENMANEVRMPGVFPRP